MGQASLRHSCSEGEFGHMGQSPTNAGKLGKKDREALSWVLKQMSANKVFTLKLGDWEIQMSQYAYAPAQAGLPVAAPPKPKAPEPIAEAIAGPFSAFRQPKPWEKVNAQRQLDLEDEAKRIAAQTQTQPDIHPATFSPTDPNGEMDYDSLLGANIPGEQ